MSLDRPTPYAELAEVIGNLPLLLREARRARGLSQRAAAREMGISFATVSRFERGDDGMVSNAVAIMRWLDQTARPDGGPLMPTCDFTAHWWDGDNEGTYTCVLGPGHLALHFTGREWLDEYGDPQQCRCPAEGGCPVHHGTLPLHPEPAEEP